jgi:hypothetical protein
MLKRIKLVVIAHRECFWQIDFGLHFLLLGFGQGFVRFHVVFLLSRPPPRTSAESHETFDSLENLGKAISFPRPGTDGAPMFAEIGIE